MKNGANSNPRSITNLVSGNLNSFRTSSYIFIINREVHVDMKSCEDKNQTRSCIRHEIGHTVYAPITIATAEHLIHHTKNLLRVEDQIAAMICNVAEDMIVDYNLVKDFNDDLPSRITKSIKKQKKNKNPFFNSIIEFYNICSKQTIIKITDKKAIEIAKKSYTIVGNVSSMFTKVIKIAKLYVEEARKQQNGLDQLKEALEKYIKHVSQNAGNHSTKTSMNNNKNKYKEKIGDIKINRNDKSSKGFSKDGGYYGVQFNDFDYYKFKARKNIRLKALQWRNKVGKVSKGALVGWNSHESPDELDMEQTMFDSGIIIPDVTTLKFEQKIGTDDVGKAMPDVLLSVDTSGSMNREDALISLFSFIEAARFYNVKCSIILFHYNVYLFNDFTIEYDYLQRQCYEKFQSGGTHILDAVNKIESMRPRGKLIVMVTDWEDNNNEECLSRLKKLDGENHVCTVVIGNHGDSSCIRGRIPTVHIKHEKELDNILIDLVREVMV
jgi:hypothetical protein